jgi:ribosomal protein S18 acetylase RimI-like enzyme
MFFEQVAPEALRPLRQAVLRPHQRAEDLVYEGDALPGALHLGAREGPGGPVVASASITPEPHPSAPARGDWRLRGMAALPEVRGRGVGAALLERCLEHARASGGRRVWCNARTPVQGFYELAGFTVEGDVFDLPVIGPHVVMVVEL